MNGDVERVLFTREEIEKKVKEAAAWLDEKFVKSDKPPIAICVLKGSSLFFCDLVREMKVPVQMEFFSISLFGAGGTSTGKPKILLDVPCDVTGRDVILVESVVDSGYTLSSIRKLFAARGVKSFTSVVLVNKLGGRQAMTQAEYSCFETEETVVGYGLDYAQRYRTLPYIGVLKSSVYEK